MKTINTDCYGIAISSDPSIKIGYSISSSMKRLDTPENKTFNAAVESLEAMILAHFCAGIDITSAAYLEGVITAYKALANNTNNDADSDDIVTIKKSRRVNALADETIHYEINQADWKSALDEHDNEEMALRALQHDQKIIRSYSEAEIDEVNEEFGVEVVEV